MSALHQTTPEIERSRTPRLRAVPRAAVVPVGRLPFGILVATLLVVGMIGLLLLNTQLQTQAFEANRLKRHAAELAHVEGELEQNVVEASSTRELNRRATALGLRPNHGIAYVDVARGTVSNAPRPEDGLFQPFALTLSPEEQRERYERESLNSAQHRAETELKAASDARDRVLGARAKAEAEARAKAEADARAKAEAEARAQAHPAAPNGAR